MSHLNNDSLSGYGKILKNHILLLANADINVPLYQNKPHESADNETTEYTMNSPKLGDNDYSKEEDTLNDPYSNFFNCLVENDFFLSMNKINKIINNNEIKYICYGNKLNFINLIKFFSFKIVRLITILTTQTYDDVDKFAENTETLLKSIRFLTKLMPIFFEVCYNETDDDSEIYFTEDEIFWNANTSETYQDLNNPTQNATVRAPESILSFDKFNKSPVSSKDESEKSISSLNVEINFKAKQNPDEFSTQPNWFLDGVAQKNNLPLGISLLSALLKCLFMEGFTLSLSSAASMGNISFHLWNNDALDLHNKDGNYSKMQNPTLDSNRLEIMDLLQVLFSNTLYSAKKIDNKFLASWCCSMPEYLSVYLINSLLNNFTDENNILAKSNITTDKAIYNPNFAYPQEYHVVKFKSFNSHQGNNANRMSLLKQNFTMNNELESTYRTAEAFTSQSSNFLPNLSNYQEEVLTIEESSKLKENYLKTSRNILLLYFTFDPNAISQNTKLQIANSTSDINDYNNVCLRSFASVNTLSDFKKILISIVKVLKLPIDMAIEDDNKIFNLNNKTGSSFLDIFTKSTTSSSGSESKNEAASDKSKNESSQTDDITEIPLISQNITSVLLIFNKMLESNEFFETHVLEIYSNKVFFILLFYLKKYHQNLYANSKFMSTLENLMLRITSNPIFSLRSMKFLNTDYYTEKVPKLLKLLDMDLNIPTETHRDFFIKHICNIILKNVEMNHAPKINHYHMLNNLLLATPQHLSQEQRGNVCQLLEMEQRNENSVLGNFTSGINFLTSKKIILVIFSFIKNREYLHTFSVDRNKNYRTQLEKTSMDQLKSRDSFSMSSASSTNSYTYTANNSSCCDSLFSDTNNALMYETTTGVIDINPVSKIPYIFTVACKWECVSVMLKTITNVISQYFDDYANLIFLLGKYKNILYELSRAIAILDKDIGNELQPLMLKFLPPGVSKKSIYSTSSLNIPFDIALHSYPTVLDEVLSIDDDSMNDFDPMPLNVMKKNSIASISSEPIEDMFYESGNNNISFIDSNNSSILDLTTGRRVLYSSGSLLSQNEDDKGSLSLNTGNTNKQVMVKESVNDLFMPHYYNNATYNAVSCIRPPGMTKKRIKKMIVKNSDNFRQAITTANQNNKGFWFLGSRYLMYLITFAHKVSDVIGVGNFEGSQGEAQTKLLVKKILKERQNIINDKRVVGALPLEVTYYNHELYIFPRTDYNPLGYQFLQTLVWTEIFNNNSVDYKYFSEEISGNADLLYNLNTSHTSVLSVDEGNTTPSSPMLERWNSNNSLSKVESNASGASYHSSLNTNTHISKDIHLRVMSGGSDSYNGSIMDQIKYSTFLIESVGTKSKDLKFVVSSGLSQSLKWYNTNVKMFPIKKTETNEFSLIDYTSNFLNKFKFRNSIAIKTPEEVAADEIKRVYTPRSSISSMPSRK